MTPLAIGYSIEDLAVVRQLEEVLADRLPFAHLAVERENEGTALATRAASAGGDLVLVISHDFLTNPNCMLGALAMLQPVQRVFLLAVDTDLNSRSAQMHYISHWQDRYIELRRGAEVFGDADKEAFDRYLAKIRETSIGVTEVIERLHALGSITNEALARMNYIPLLQFAAPAEKPSPSQAPPDTVPQKSPPVHTPTSAQAPPQDAAELIDHAWQLSDRGETGAALELLHQGREAQPEQIDLHYQHALMLALAARRPEAARTELNSLLEREPLHEDALYLSGELYEAEEQYAEARRDWERLSDLQPFYPDLNQRLGMLVADHFPDHFIEAGNFLQRASKYEDVGAEVLYRYAELLLGPLGRRKKARKWLDKTIAADPKHAPAHYQLAVMLFDAGRQEEARKNYLLAVSLEPAYDTPANRRAFYGVSAEAPSLPVEVRAAAPASAAATVPPEADPLGALKKNIADLEALLSTRQAPAPAAPPRRGQGKTVLISGATSGIGLATARRLAADGYRLILLGRREDRLEEISRELVETHAVETYAVVLDVRERAGVGRAIEALPEAWRTIDVLINNAGKAKGFDPIQEGKLDHWDEMIDVNLKGLLYLTRAVTPGMVARGHGTIINVASTAGKEVYPKGNVYCATKHAVDALTYAMRLDLVSHGIRVGQICPAHVEETEFALVRFDGDKERAKIYQDFQPLRSRDVAEAIHFMIDQPPHVNVMDLVLQGTQQASSTVVDRSGRGKFAPAEEE